MKRFLSTLMLMFGLVVLVQPVFMSPTYAKVLEDDGGGSTTTPTTPPPTPADTGTAHVAPATDQAACNNGGVKLSIGFGTQACAGGNGQNPILGYLRLMIQFVSGMVGLSLVLMIVISGLQYMTSQGNAPAITKAKTHIFAAVIGLIVFVLMYAIFNYLIPGGVF